MRVVDASAMIDLLSGAPNASQVAAALDDDLFAPDLLIAEVVHHFRYELLGGRVSEGDALAAIRLFEAADVEYVSVAPLIERVWTQRHNVSAYDACYVAVAGELGCALVTSDRRLANTPGLGVPVLLTNP